MQCGGRRGVALFPRRRSVFVYGTSTGVSQRHWLQPTIVISTMDEWTVLAGSPRHGVLQIMKTLSPHSAGLMPLQRLE